MPLKKGKFAKNVAMETNALEEKGNAPKKAMKQAVAIASGAKREAPKKKK